MMRLSLVLLILVALFAACLPTLPAQSQEETPPLIGLLSMAPASAGTVKPGEFLFLSYADIRANEQARPGVPTPATWDEYAALDEENFDLWYANYARLISIAPDIVNLIIYDDQLDDYYGFDFFEIDQTLSFRLDRPMAAVYRGHFETDRITSTLTARGYTTTTLNGIDLLCGPVGCENGAEIRQWLPDQKRDEVTFRISGGYPIFGGRMGQQQPIGLLPDALLSTEDWEAMDHMTAATAGSEDSLYSVPDYRAIADFAVTGNLIQVFFFAPSFFNAATFSENLENIAVTMDEDVETLREMMQVDTRGVPLGAEDLPAYSVGAIVDWQDGAEQVHHIVLVYSDETSAQFAAAEVSKRIPMQTGFLIIQDERPLVDVYAQGYTLDPPQVVHDPNLDRWLAVATVRYPLPSNEPDPAHDDLIPVSGRLLLAWYRSITMDAFLPGQLP